MFVSGFETCGGFFLLGVCLPSLAATPSAPPWPDGRVDEEQRDAELPGGGRPALGADQGQGDAPRLQLLLLLPERPGHGGRQRRPRPGGGGGGSCFLTPPNRTV